MHDKLDPGAHVRTVKPARESTDWQPAAKLARRWNLDGKVIGHSDSHGLCYEVEHEDGSKAWYERRELQRMDVHEFTPVEREEMIAKMDLVAAGFYGQAAKIGVHAFIEFSGLMNEWIKVCSAANKQGIAFEMANTHNGTPLPFEPWNAAYLAEKLNCIYGPSLLANERSRKLFIDTLFDGQYRLVPSVEKTANDQAELYVEMDSA